MSFPGIGQTTIGNKEKIRCWGERPQVLEVNMTTLNRIAIVAALLAGGTSLAIAQTSPQTPANNGTKYNCAGARQGVVECQTKHMSANSANSEEGSSAATTPQNGSDTVILSEPQRRAVWNDLSKQATDQNASGFEAQTGTFMPGSVKIEPIPSNATSNNPELRPYDYAMVDHYLVIVDPKNKVIVDVFKK
jgi:hypothetical protein